MTQRNPQSRSLTARLDALRFELKAEISTVRSELKSDIAALAGEFRELKGTLRGAAIVIATCVPLVTAIAVAAVNVLTRHVIG